MASGYINWLAQLPAQKSSSGYCRMLGQSLVPEKLCLAELCCGHMGGWHAAADAMEAWEVTVALDSDPEATCTYMANYGGTLVKNPDEISEDTTDLTVLCHDLTDFKWLQVFNHKDVSVFSLSTPCQSWSGMGSASGTASANGQVMTAAVQCVRLVQPPIIMVEQVQGFRQHPEYESYAQAMVEAGYKLMVSGVHDLALLSHSSRKRWLAVWMNSATIQRWDLVGRFMSPIVRESPKFHAEAHCLHFFSEEYAKDLQIQPEEMQLCEDASVLPPWKRNNLSPNETALSVRVVQEGWPTPTVTASYRKATSFSRTLLQEKGLMSWFVRDPSGKVRWFDKFEAAYAMGYRSGHVLPATQGLGFHAVCNSIATFHAALTMSHAQDIVRDQMGHGTPSKFRTVLEGLRRRQGCINEHVVREHGMHFHKLVSRLPQKADEIMCPHCKNKTNLPFITACQQCGLMACTACYTEVCLPSHQVVDLTCEPQDDLWESLHEPSFTVRDADTNDMITLSCVSFASLRA